MHSEASELNLDNRIDYTAEVERKMMSLERRRITIGYEPDGTPITRMLKAANQDEMNDRIVQAFIESGRIRDFLPATQSLFPASTVLLQDYAKEWLNRKRKVKESTKVTYQKRLANYIIPELGSKPIADISSSDVQNLLDKHKNLSAKTLKETKGVLSQIFRYAISDSLITKNPCNNLDVEIPSTKRKVRSALSITDYHDIISNLFLLRRQDRLFLALCLFTAMRRGEVLGLRWEDIHHGMIHVRRNVVHPQKNSPEITTPKTNAGIRSIPLIQPLQKILIPFEDSGFIIGGENPLTASAFRAMWKRIKNTIDMHGATPHVLRHSYLTYAVGATTDFKTIQGISGHADLFTLLNTYAHVQDDKMLELSAKMSKILT